MYADVFLPSGAAQLSSEYLSPLSLSVPPTSGTHRVHGRTSLRPARCVQRGLLRQGEKRWMAPPRECLPSSATTRMLKNAHVVKIDNYVFEEENFPLAVPPTPRPRIRKVSPAIHISPVGCPDYLLSIPPPQEDASLIVPVRSSRAGRQRRQERLPPSPCPLPALPGPPSCPNPKISCCPWANNRPMQPSPTTPLNSSEAEDAATRSLLVLDDLRERFQRRQ